MKLTLYVMALEGGLFNLVVATAARQQARHPERLRIVCLIVSVLAAMRIASFCNTVADFRCRRWQ